MPSKGNQLPKGGTVEDPASEAQRAAALPGRRRAARHHHRRRVVRSSGADRPVRAARRKSRAWRNWLSIAQQIDFGKVPLDIPVKATFKLSNVGDQPLQILGQPIVEVKQGC